MAAEVAVESRAARVVVAAQEWLAALTGQVEWDSQAAQVELVDWAE